MQTTNKRTTLVLKEEYADRIVVRYIDKIGEIKMDTRAVTPGEYENYVRMGFGDCFEEVPQEDLTGESLATAKAEAIAEMANEGKGTEDEEGFEEEEEEEEEGDDDPADEEDAAPAAEGCGCAEGESCEKCAVKADAEGEDADAAEAAAEGTEDAKAEPVDYMTMDWAEVKKIAAKRDVKIASRKREAVAADLKALDEAAAK